MYCVFDRYISDDWWVNRDYLNNDSSKVRLISRADFVRLLLLLKHDIAASRLAFCLGQGSHCV